MEKHLWKLCPLISIDPEVVSGEPVFKGTRLPVEATIDNYYAYRELEGFSDQQAIEATLESFPSIPGGAEGLRAVLAFEASYQLQPIS